MNIFDFKLIISDAYELDSWLPTLCTRNGIEFKEVSYTIAALDNLEDFIEYEIGIGTQSIEKYIITIEKYINRSIRFADYNRENSLIFITAAKVGRNIIDILKGMI